MVDWMLDGRQALFSWFFRSVKSSSSSCMGINRQPSSSSCLGDRKTPLLVVALVDGSECEDDFDRATAVEGGDNDDKTERLDSDTFSV
jgi:hypothetical protein